MPCCSLGAASIRQASMTMSCVADEKATKSAQTTVHINALTGSPKAMPMLVEMCTVSPSRA